MTFKKLMNSFCLYGKITEQHAKDIENILIAREAERQQDINSVLNMLEGTTKRFCVINYIKKYMIRKI